MRQGGCVRASASRGAKRTVAHDGAHANDAARGLCYGVANRGRGRRQAATAAGKRANRAASRREQSLRDLWRGLRPARRNVDLCQGRRRRHDRRRANAVTGILFCGSLRGVRATPAGSACLERAAAHEHPAYENVIPPPRSGYSGADTTLSREPLWFAPQPRRVALDNGSPRYPPGGGFLLRTCAAASNMTGGMEECDAQMPPLPKAVRPDPPLSLSVRR